MRDHPGLVVGIEAPLRRRGFLVEACESVAEAFRQMRQEGVDAIVAGFDLGGMSGVEFCRHACRDQDRVPILLLVPPGDPAVLDAATRAGAHGVLVAPVDIQALDLALDRAVEHAALRRAVERLEEVVRQGTESEELVGGSPVMRELFEVVERAATSTAPVLVTGESGTGKELVARALHRQRQGGRGPFTAINLSAVPGTLLESELYGHARGAFTDAKSARKGLFVQAGGGTLFLDEIGELGLELQPKLLRAIQERQVRPVGGDTEVPFEARIVAATNRDLEAMVKEGRFREDLYYRLAVIHIHLPPLRSRGSDVLLIANHILERVAGRVGRQLQGISNAAAQRLLAYHWPGNIRELENVIERAVALTRNREVGVEDLPPRIRGTEPEHGPAAPDDPDELVSMDEIERRYIARVLRAVNGNKSRAAVVLGLDRKTLYRKLQRYGLGA